jgi:trk system potassium uptake protein TrkH
VFGQVTVLLLIQIGGLGYMAVTTVVGVALGRQLSMQERRTLSEAFNVQSMDGLVRFVFTVLKLTLAFEVVGALVLTVRWMDDLGPARAAYYGLFHAVSAFNNAGFALFSDNMIRYRGDVIVNLVITGLVICGGLGFVVLSELGRWRQMRRFSTHTRLVLALTGSLLVGCTAVVAALEWHNPATLGPLGVGEALLASWFQAVVPRTAGFNSVDVAALMPATLFITMVLMFIGAAPGGTAGGVKVTTFTITAVSLWAMIRGNEEPTLLRRRLSSATVGRAFAICLLAFLTVNVVAGLLLHIEGRQLLPTLFEATSAFGTVGLSISEPGDVVSLSSHFGWTGKTLIALLMFVGRVGPLTLAVAVARRRSVAAIRYPEGKILIG